MDTEKEKEKEKETPPRADFTRRMEERLEKLKEEFQRLELEQMKRGELEARKRLEAAKRSVTEKRDLLVRELGRARSVSDQAWEDVRETLRGAWIEMKEAVDRARADFQQGREDE